MSSSSASVFGSFSTGSCSVAGLTLKLKSDDSAEDNRAQRPSPRTDMQLQSTLTCPKCTFQAVETMPTDACQFFYDCKGCGERLKPLAGDCCVFCSYGSVPCPPVQSNLRCCVPKVH